MTQYDNQMFLNIGDEPELLSGSDLLSQKNQLTSVENSQLKISRVRWGDSEENAFLRESGQFRKLGRNSRLDLVGHGSFLKKTIGDKSPEEIVDFVVDYLVDESRHFRALAIKACKVICEWDDEFIDRLFKAFERRGVQVDQITAPSKSVFIGIGERTWALIGSIDNPNAVVENRPAGTRFLATYQDGVTDLKPRSGIIPDGAALRKTYSEISAYAALSSSESRESPLLSITVSLLPSELTITSPDLQTRLNRLGSDLIRGRGILPADITPLLLAMSEARDIGRLTVTDVSTLKVAGVQAAVELAGNSATPADWLAKLGDFPEAKQALTTWLEQQPDSLEAFRRLQERANNNGFAFYTADPTSEDGAAFINHDNVDPFAVVLVDSLPGCGGGGGRARRQACSTEEIEEQARVATEGLTLLSDYETRILAGSSADDIALHTSEPGSVLARVQDGIHDFRRATASQRISDHEGYHNVIALDEESFAAAQTLAQLSNRESDEKGRALKLSTDGRGHPVLLTDDGRVVTMVEGGSRNRLSIVGKTETFEGFSASEMAAGVRSLVRGERIGSVSVHPVLEEGEGFRLEESFRELEVSEPSSPWREVADTVRLQALEKKASVVVNGGTSVVEKGHLQAGVPGRSETYLFDGEFFRDALNLGSADQPGTLERQLRDKVDELHRQGRTAEREVYESLTLDYASKLRNLRAQFEVFRAAMDQVYRANNLSFDEDIPLLSSLHQDEKGGWKMEFTDRDMIRAPRVIPIEDERIIRFVHDYNDNIEKVRVTLKLNHELTPESLNRALVEGELLESVEAIDGFGLAMVMQTLIGLAGKDQDELTLKNIKNADYRRALIVHQALGLAFGTKVVLGVALDVGKYVAALLTGKSASIPERLMTRVAASLEKVLGKELSKGAIKGLAKVPRFASGALDGVLTVAFIGVDIDELIHADTPAGKELAKVQLGVDSLSLVFPATSLFWVP